MTRGVGLALPSSRRAKGRFAPLAPRSRQTLDPSASALLPAVLFPLVAIWAGLRVTANVMHIHLFPGESLRTAKGAWPARTILCRAAVGYAPGQRSRLARSLGASCARLGSHPSSGHIISGVTGQAESARLVHDALVHCSVVRDCGISVAAVPVPSARADAPRVASRPLPSAHVKR